MQGCWQLEAAFEILRVSIVSLLQCAVTAVAPFMVVLIHCSAACQDLKPSKVCYVSASLIKCCKCASNLQFCQPFLFLLRLCSYAKLCAMSPWESWALFLIPLKHHVRFAGDEDLEMMRQLFLIKIAGPKTDAWPILWS